MIDTIIINLSQSGKIDWWPQRSLSWIFRKREKFATRKYENWIETTPKRIHKDEQITFDKKQKVSLIFTINKWINQYTLWLNTIINNSDIFWFHERERYFSSRNDQIKLKYNKISNLLYMEGSPQRRPSQEDKKAVAARLIRQNPNYVPLEIHKNQKCTLNCFDKKK